MPWQIGVIYHEIWLKRNERDERCLESFKWLPEWVIKGRDACDMCLSADWQLHVPRKGIFIQLLSLELRCEEWKHRADPGLGALSSLTFSLNPSVLDAASLPVLRVIIFRVLLCVRQVDDEPESRQWGCDVLGCVPERAKRKKTVEEMEKCRLLFAFLPFNARKTLANVLWKGMKKAENKLSHYAVQLVVLSLLSLPLVIEIIPHSISFVTQVLLQEEKREIYRRLQRKKKRLSGHIAQDALLSVR